MENFFEQLKSIVNPGMLAKNAEKTTMKIIHYLLINLKTELVLKKG